MRITQRPDTGGQNTTDMGLLVSGEVVAPNSHHQRVADHMEHQPAKPEATLHLHSTELVPIQPGDEVHLVLNDPEILTEKLVAFESFLRSFNETKLPYDTSEFVDTVHLTINSAPWTVNNFRDESILTISLQKIQSAVALVNNQIDRVKQLIGQLSEFDKEKQQLHTQALTFLQLAANTLSEIQNEITPKVLHCISVIGSGGFGTVIRGVLLNKGENPDSLASHDTLVIKVHSVTSTEKLQKHIFAIEQRLKELPHWMQPSIKLPKTFSKGTYETTQEKRTVISSETDQEPKYVVNTIKTTHEIAIAQLEAAQGIDIKAWVPKSIDEARLVQQLIIKTVDAMQQHGIIVPDSGGINIDPAALEKLILYLHQHNQTLEDYLRMINQLTSPPDEQTFNIFATPVIYFFDLDDAIIKAKPDPKKKRKKTTKMLLQKTHRVINNMPDALPTVHVPPKDIVPETVKKGVVGKLTRLNFITFFYNPDNKRVPTNMAAWADQHTVVIEMLNLLFDKQKIQAMKVAMGGDRHGQLANIHLREVYQIPATRGPQQFEIEREIKNARERKKEELTAEETLDIKNRLSYSNMVEVYQKTMEVLELDRYPLISFQKFKELFAFPEIGIPQMARIYFEFNAFFQAYHQQVKKSLRLENPQPVDPAPPLSTYFHTLLAA